MAKNSAPPNEILIRKHTVTLEGLTPILFDRYPGNNKTVLKWQDRLYLPPGSDVVSLPTINVSSFFTAQNSMSAPKRLRLSKVYKNVCNACMSFLLIKGLNPQYPDYIPFTRGGSEIRVGTFNSDRDERSGIYRVNHVARLPKGIPNPKERPALDTPWELTFGIELIDNNEVDEVEIHNLLVHGGLAIGFGTFRGVYGKFKVTSFV
jgi:hypothetical protein